MKKNFLTMMKRSLLAISAVVAMGMITASLTSCCSSDDELSQDETVSQVHKTV